MRRHGALMSLASGPFGLFAPEGLRNDRAQARSRRIGFPKALPQVKLFTRSRSASVISPVKMAEASWSAGFASIWEEDCGAGNMFIGTERREQGRI